MGELVAKLWQQTDAVNLAALVVFWLRWELWTRSHNRHHLELEQLATRRKAHA